MCVYVSQPVFMCFCVTSPVSFPCQHWTAKASNWLSFLLLFCTHTRSHMRKLSLLQTQQKLDSAFHTTTCNGHGWEEGRQTYNPSCNDYDFLALKKGFHCLNESKWKRCSLRGKKLKRRLVTPSCWVSENFITGELLLFYIILATATSFTVLFLQKLCVSKKQTHILDV